MPTYGTDQADVIKNLPFILSNEKKCCCPSQSLDGSIEA